MLYYALGSKDTDLGPDELRTGLAQALDAIGPRRKVLAVPPDITRLPSQAGPLTRMAHDYYGDALAGILPATGTHHPMSEEQIELMFGDLPRERFLVHDWQNDLATLGRIEAERIRELSEGKLDFDWPAQVNRRIASGEYDLVLSIGQVVPHEVIGMANYNKNIFVGTGGAEAIAKSHYLGAVYGMERIMGRADSPVRAVLNEATDRFARELPIVYVLTVVEAVPEEAGSRLVVRGLFVGDDSECYERAAALAREVNVFLLDEPLSKVVAYMDPREYSSTWVGNKAIYRTRMAIADGGELVVIAPGVKQYGENELFDRLIAKHGYRGTEATLAAVASDSELGMTLSAAAHLIHGSSEGRFRIAYAAGGIPAAGIERVGFEPADLAEVTARYNPDTMRDGWNTMPDGEEVFYISNPALGLWAEATRFGAIA
ncbi:MAG: lactate racemase domain-containing protein [Spirochaetota bacterium]